MASRFHLSRALLLSLLISIPALAVADHGSDESIPLLPVRTLYDVDSQPEVGLEHVERFIKGPIASASSGFARVTQVGISVNKGAQATLRYRIRVKAVTAHQLTYSDSPFLDALKPYNKEKYLAIRNLYSGGLDVPFLNFLGWNLNDKHGKGKRDISLNDDEYGRLSTVAEKILKEATHTTIVAKGKLKATGITCMKTTAYAFVKVAKVQLNDDSNLTVFTTKEDDILAATKHADTLLPSKKGAFKQLHL